MPTPPIDPSQGLRALSEATSDSLSELMSRNPLEMTDSDITRIVEEFRAIRKRWAIAELAGKKSLPKTQAKLPAPNTPSVKDIEF